MILSGNTRNQPLTTQILLDLLKDYKRPFDKIAELVRQKALIQVKRGIFIPGPALNIPQPEPFLLANHIAGPSYVSLEAALSHWRMIPEQVYEVTSVTTRRSKTYDTPAGRFSYRHLPLPYYSFGQQSLKLAKNQVALVATPEKSIMRQDCYYLRLIVSKRCSIDGMADRRHADRQRRTRALRLGMIRELTLKQAEQQVEHYWSGKVSENSVPEYLFQGKCKLTPL